MCQSYSQEGQQPANRQRRRAFEPDLKGTIRSLVFLAGLTVLQVPELPSALRGLNTPCSLDTNLQIYKCKLGYALFQKSLSCENRLRIRK